jgi:hypothetical protein
MHIKLLSLPVKEPKDLDGAFAAILKERADALLVLADVSSCTTVSG